MREVHLVQDHIEQRFADCKGRSLLKQPFV